MDELSDAVDFDEHVGDHIPPIEAKCVQGVKFLRVMSEISNKSSHWNYFLRSEDRQKGLCDFRNCNTTISCKGGNTTGMRKHLLTVHKINIDEFKDPKGWFGYCSIRFR